MWSMRRNGGPEHGVKSDGRIAVCVVYVQGESKNEVGKKRVGVEPGDDAGKKIEQANRGLAIL